MTSQTYNGHRNWWTWCVQLWIDNDEYLYETAREMTRDAIADELPAYDFADRLKLWIDDVAEETCPGCREGASFVSDLIGAALSEVAWQDIAESMIETERDED